MELEILRAATGFVARNTTRLRTTINLRVVPAHSDIITIGEHHFFSKRTLRSGGGKTGIDASVILVSDEDNANFAKERIDPQLLRAGELVGYARAEFADSADQTASLEFVLFAEEESVSKLSRLFDWVGPADASCFIQIKGLRYGLRPDEEIWDKPDDRDWDILPIFAYTFNVLQLATTQDAVRDVEDKRMWEEELDSGDSEDRGRAKIQLAEIDKQNLHPLHKSVREIRAGLLLLIALIVVIGFVLLTKP